MKRNILLATLLMACCCQVVTAQTDDRKWQLVWSDEFDYTGLPDSTKWGYDTGGHGWGNNEKQFYTVKRLQNASVKNGLLSITAVKEKYKNAGYTSARLLSKNKGDWKYGRIEVRAQLPKGRGLWPAIWMLPTDWKYGDWPISGEIDIMEHVGYLPDSLFGTVHTGAYNHRIGTQKGNNIFRNDVSSAFHNYVLVWDENKMEIYVDDEKYFTFNNEKKTEKEWPFDQRFHLLLNVAVGGDWGGKKGIDDAVFPQSMQVDYVRVYQ
ncbi:glycoside hydrolase family 16 protein [Foetidibacter luteolus]|uniref:glycoside hydrolase family 16 protein n=1 Tax=Foetidibacter luteolus TaxID=2608880 RepID=UPI001A9841E9|nr:glycoside hydrolase family 16 protein [Foetidibacter luteolus]